MNREAIEASIAATGSKVTYTGAGGAILGWLLSSEFGILMGVLLGLAGFVVNLYFKLRADRRKQREHEAYMRKLGIGDTAPLPIDEADE